MSFLRKQESIHYTPYAIRYFPRHCEESRFIGTTWQSQHPTSFSRRRPGDVILNTHRAQRSPNMSLPRSLCPRKRIVETHFPLCHTERFPLPKTAKPKTPSSTTADMYLMAGGSIQPDRVAISKLKPIAI